jgi:putative redox protein
MEYKFEKPLKGTIGEEKYKCTIEWRNGKIISDEPESSGGNDTGPDPYSLLLSSLAACTLITLRMYIDHKGWEVPEVFVNVNMYSEIQNDKNITVIDRDISFSRNLPAEQELRLQEIAKHCPISKILEGEIKVRSFVFRTGETKTINYHNDKVKVYWKPELCQHSTRCWKQLPSVFNPKIKKWINPDGASSEEIETQVLKCPSGALIFEKV